MKNITAKKFIFIISLYFCFVLNQTLWSYIFKMAEFSSATQIIALINLPLLMFAMLYLLFNIITVPYIGKPLIVFLLLCSALADYAMKNMSVVIDSDMVRNFVETTTREAMDLVTPRAMIYVFIFGVLPSLWVIFVKINYRSRTKEIKQRLLYAFISVIIPLLIAPLCYKEYVSFGRNHSVVRHYINTFNYISAVNRYYKKSRNAHHEFVILDEKPILNKKADSAPRLLVYIVGETARSQNFSLYGYEKETNPELKKEDVIVFKDVTSCGTATTVSVPCMFSHLGRDDFKVNHASYTENLLDIVKAAGYDVFWDDNDDGCKDVCNRVENRDSKAGNRQPYCFGKYCQDDVLLDGLEERIKNAKKDTVIVLHQMGSHGPTYYKRYPDKFKRFKPTCDSSDLPECSQEEIINTYDNTILYTDYVIDSVIEILKRHPQYASAMLYVSDHGESLGENNIYLHGLPYAIAPKVQKTIPMILWLSDKIKKDVNIDTKRLKEEAEKKSYSHDNLFHSILHLLSVETTAGQKERKKLDIFL